MSTMHREYKGRRDEEGEASVTVTVVTATGTEVRSLPLRLDLARHSPTGPEWAYEGSGPAQLALAILADALNAAAREPLASPTVLGTHLRGLIALLSIALVDRELHPDRSKDADAIALRLYQHYKRERIARLDRDAPWSLSNDDVRAWLDGVAVRVEADPDAWGRR